MSFLNIRKKHPEEIKEDEKFLPLEKDQIGISDKASEKIDFLLKEKGLLNGFLKIAVMGGGCSGFTIHYDLCENPKENDIIFSKNSAKVCIDKKSLGILGGSTLHIKEILGVQHFILVNNPKSKQCSCGQSFSL